MKKKNLGGSVLLLNWVFCFLSNAKVSKFITPRAELLHFYDIVWASRLMFVIANSSIRISLSKTGKLWKRLSTTFSVQAFIKPV